MACGQPQPQAAASELLVMIGISVQFCFHSKGKAYKGRFLATGDAVLVLRKDIFHFLAKLCAGGLHPAHTRLPCAPFLELELLCTAP